MKLPHSTVQVERRVFERFKSARFISTNFAKADIVGGSNVTVSITINEIWDWNSDSLDEFAGFCGALAKQLRADNKE